MAAGSPVGADVGHRGELVGCLAIGPRVGTLGGSEAVVHVVAPRRVERHAVGGIGREQRRGGAVEQLRDIVGLHDIAAQQAVVTQAPQVTGLGAWGTPGFLECRLEVERFRPVALLAGLQLPEQVLHRVLVEARQREVEIRARPEVREQARQELVVPGAADLVEREPQEPRLLDRDVEPGHRNGRETQPPRGDEALVAADDGPVLASGQHRLDEAELAEAALEGVELVVANPPWVGGIGAKLVDRDLLDDEV